jgi:hypothetical protein
MMKKLFKTSQVDPGMALPAPTPLPAPDPLAGAAPAPAIPPMGGGLPMDPGMGMPTDPMAAPAPTGDRQEIIGPINSIAQVFYDYDVAKYIQNNLHLNEKDLASKIWSEYGGNPDGTSDESKSGKRTDNNLKLSPEDANKEREQTKNSKWERLEENKTIEDIISLSELGNIVKGLIYGVVMKSSAQAAAPPGGAPAGGIFAANRCRIKIAKALEKEYLFNQTDAIINDIFLNTPI